MSLEIELKARLADCAPVEKRLSVLGTYCRSYKKSDSYWFPAQTVAGGMSLPLSGVRIRRESGTDTNGIVHESVLVTYKNKEITDGIEVNDEREFTVSSSSHEAGSSTFEDLLGRLGLYRGICKEKQGRSWIVSPDAAGGNSILAEVSLVTGLGWFLEIEIVTDDTGEGAIAESRKQLLALLEKLEIPAESIESRPYTAMLREKG
jgi:adenylate cyclase class 2